MRFSIFLIFSLLVFSCKKVNFKQEKSTEVFHEDFSNQGDWVLTTLDTNYDVSQIMNGVLELNSKTSEKNSARLDLSQIEFGKKVRIKIGFEKFSFSNTYELTDPGEVPVSFINLGIGDVLIGVKAKNAYNYTDYAPKLDGKTLVINVNLRLKRFSAFIEEDDKEVSDYFYLSNIEDDSFISFETIRYMDVSSSFISETRMVVNDIKMYSY